MDRYAGRTCLVTGAAGGIGRACVERLLGEGAQVIALDRTALDHPAHPRLTSHVVDVTDGQQVDNVLSRLGRLDCLVLAAGVGSAARTGNVTDEEWQRVLDINLSSAFRIIRDSLPALRAAHGAVVTIASIAAVGGRPYSAAYSAAKGGLVALTRAMAVEHASEGVRFCCVAPGSVDTRMSQEWPTPDDADASLVGRGRSLLEQQRAHPDDIAAAVAFLGSSEARFVTGAVLVVDGGALA